MKIWLIIPFYEEKPFLIELLKSIEIESRKINLKICIVDNSKNTYKPPQGSNYFYLRTNPKIGYANAVNIGINFVLKQNARKIIICNQDVLFSKNCISELINASNNNPEDVIVPLVINYDTGCYEDYYLQSLFQQNSLFKKDYKENNLKPLYLINNIGLPVLIFEKKILDKVALFDPIYEMYFEDDDFIERIRLQNRKLLLCTRSIIKHKGSEYKRPGYRYNNPFQRSKLIYEKRWKKNTINLILSTVIQIIKGAIKLNIKKIKIHTSNIIFFVKNKSSIQDKSNDGINKRIRKNDIDNYTYIQ